MTDPWSEFRREFTREQPDANAPIFKWPPLIEYNCFEKKLVPKPKPIIDNLLEDFSRMIIGGASKTYKSWVMSEQAVCISCGVSWWGFETHKSRVLYVNFELKEYHAQRRFKAIRDAKALSIDSDWFFIWNLRDEDISIEPFESELIALIKTHAIALVFIDPFYTLLGERDERVSSELVPVLSMFSRINRETGASVVCSAHFTKGNQTQKDPIDRISGGASIHRHPDCLMTLTKHKADQAFTVDFVCRDFAPIEPFVVQWNYPVLVRGELNPQDLKNAGRPSIYKTEQILDMLADFDDEFNSKELQEKLQEETGMSRSKFYELLETLKNQKKVFRSKATDKWNLSSI